MKKMMCLGLMVLMFVSLAACGNNSAPPPQPAKISGSVQTEKPKRKILIAYFSQARFVSEGADAVASSTPFVGNTASAAREIQKQVGGDVFEIVTVDTYPVDHRAASAIAERELKSNSRPALSTHVKDMGSYDVIFLGYPIWWYTEPMAIRTFLEEYNFSGKTIVPFCTTLGAGIADSISDIKKISPNATVLEGLTLRTGRQDMSSDISKWLNKIGMAQ